MTLSDGSTFRFNDNSEAIIKAMRAKAEVALEAVGIHIEGEAKEELENTPRRIDTGLLRNSITHAVSGHPAAVASYHADKGSKKFNSKDSEGNRVKKRRSAKAKYAGSVGVGFYSGTAPEDPEDSKAVYIGTNVEYAIYVHEGTSRMAPNRFLKNACLRNENQIKNYIRKELESTGNIPGALQGVKPTVNVEH